MANVSDIVHEFQDLFPKKFSEMKGILEYLVEMRIPLNPYANPVQKRPYCLNPRYKETVKA